MIDETREPPAAKSKTTRMKFVMIARNLVRVGVSFAKTCAAERVAGKSSMTITNSLMIGKNCEKIRTLGEINAKYGAIAGSRRRA